MELNTKDEMISINGWPQYWIYELTLKCKIQRSYFKPLHLVKQLCHMLLKSTRIAYIESPAALLDLTSSHPEMLNTRLFLPYFDLRLTL